MNKPSNNTFYNVGDCIEFKSLIPSLDDDKDYTLCKGRIINNNDKNLLDVEIYNDNDKKKSSLYTQKTCWVNPFSIVNHYPKKIIPRLSVRLILKKIWKDLIIRKMEWSSKSRHT